MNNEVRLGRVTSSVISKVVANGRSSGLANPDVKWNAGALTLFEEKRIEKRFGRCLDSGGYSQASEWGLFMENIIFSYLGLEYKILSRESKVHPDKEFAPYWGGSADLLVPGVKIGEIKCYQPKKFCQIVDCMLEKDVELLKNDFESEYWQMVSNAILNKVPKAELICFMPNETSMIEIRQMAQDVEGAEAWKTRFIYELENDQLPVLKDDGYYQSVNKFEFVVPKSDIDLLTERMRLAKQELDYKKNK